MENNVSKEVKNKIIIKIVREEKKNNKLYSDAKPESEMKKIIKKIIEDEVDNNAN